AESERIEERFGRQPTTDVYDLGAHQRDHRRTAAEAEERHPGEREEQFEEGTHHARRITRPTAAPATISNAGCTGVKAATRNAAATSAALSSQPALPRRLCSALGAKAIATPSSNAMTTGRTPASAS